MGDAGAGARELIWDWNKDDRAAGRFVEFDDETLRDGLQSASVRNPGLDEKVELLSLMAATGIRFADVGMPGAGGRIGSDVEELCRAALAAGITPNCAARTNERDVGPVLDIIQRLGSSIEIALFTGCAPIRCRIEGWEPDQLERRVETAVRAAVRGGASVTFVTEDSTRSHPHDLRRLYLAAVREGADRVCVADTAGHATPVAVISLVRFVRALLAAAGAGSVGLDWHGHNDRGLGVANALTAAWAGADRLHGTALGVGERVGNPPMEQLLVNAALEGWATPRLLALPRYICRAAEMLGVDIHPQAPVVGRDAFRTATGVHAAALLKALRAGENELMDLVYSAVPAAALGRVQDVELGPMSGASNARFWLATHGYQEDERTVERMLAAAKASDRALTDEELHGLAGMK